MRFLSSLSLVIFLSLGACAMNGGASRGPASVDGHGGGAGAPEGYVVGESVDELIQAIQFNVVRENSDALFARAMNKILAKGGAAVDALIAALPNSSVQAQWRLTMLLGRLKDPKAVDVLVESLKTTQNDSQRGEATDALVKIGKPQGEAALSKLVLDAAAGSGGRLAPSDDRWLAVSYAAQGLAKLHSPHAAESIRPLLKDFVDRNNKGDGRWGATYEIKKRFMNALVVLKDADADPLFRYIAETDKNEDDAEYAKGARQFLKLTLNGQEPFERYEPARPLNEKRIYTQIFRGGNEKTYQDTESGEVIPAVRIRVGSPQAN